MHPVTRPATRSIGLLIAAVAIWGGLIPFIGPTFNFGSGPSWAWSESHASLHVAPALVAFFGAGLLMNGGRRRGLPAIGSALTVVAGAWFVIAPSLHPIWAGSGTSASHGAMGMAMGMGTTAGASSGSAGKQALEAIGYHYGTGSVIAILGAAALGLVLASAPAVAAQETAGARTRRGLTLRRGTARA